MKLSDQVRELARAKYLSPAILAGKARFSVAIRDVLQDLVSQGFPPGNTPQVCTALRKRSFLRDQGIEIESIDGPPSKMSTTVVYHYRLANPARRSHPGIAPAEVEQTGADQEEPSARAQRLTEGLRGLLKEEFAAHGGADGFLRWVRGYDEEDAA
jgi:hypothetical protein